MNNPINQITKLQPIRCLGLILILIGYSLTNLSSQTVTWSSTTMDSDWNNPNNWIPAQVPLITDNVEIGANTNSIWPEIKNGNTALAKTVKVEGADLTIKAGGRLEIINMVSQESALQKLRSGTLLIEVGAELIINAQGSGIHHNNLNNSLTGKVVNHGTIQIKNASTGISIDSNGSFENHGYIRIISSTDESIYVWQASPLGTIPSGYFINYECGYISVDENIKDYPQTNSNAGFTNDGTITIDDDEISLMQTNNGLIHNLGIGSINPQSNTGIIDDHPAANYWLGCHSTLWSDSTSWSRSRVPIAGDSVVVLDSFAINHLSIDISTDAVMHVFNLDTITILSGATLSIDGSFSNASTVNGYQNQNKTIIEAGAELNIANTISVGLLNSRAGGVSIFINNGLISANNNSGTSISNANFSLFTNNGNIHIESIATASGIVNANIGIFQNTDNGNIEVVNAQNGILLFEFVVFSTFENHGTIKLKNIQEKGIFFLDFGGNGVSTFENFPCGLVVTDGPFDFHEGFTWINDGYIEYNAATYNAVASVSYTDNGYQNDPDNVLPDDNTTNKSSTIKPNAGDEPGYVALYDTDSQIDLFAILANADLGGTWSQVLGSPASGFDAFAGTFDPSGHALGYYVFEYTIVAPNPPACFPDSSQIVNVYVRPAFDECSGAEPITVNSNGCTPQTFSGAGASPSYLFDNDLPQICEQQSFDLWFSVQVPANKNIRIEGDCDIFGIGSGFALYEGDCNSLTEVACKNYVAYDCQNSIEFYNNTSGPKTIFVRYWHRYSFTEDFDICAYEIPPPPANDYCDAAALLTVSSANSCTISTSGTTISATSGDINISNSSCPSIAINGTEIRDVWYKFTSGVSPEFITIDASNIVPLSPDPDYDYLPEVTVYSGDCSTGFDVQLCTSVGTTHFLPHAPNTEYHISISIMKKKIIDCGIISLNDLDVQATFDICLYACEPPLNDDCANAIQIVSGTCIEGSTFCSADSIVYYEFTPVVSGNYTISSSSGYDFSQIKIGDNCSNFNNTFEDLACFDFNSNITYTIEFSLFRYSLNGIEKSAGDFELCIDPLVNTICSAAKSLDQASSCNYNCVQEYFGCISQPSVFKPEQIKTNQKSLGNCIDPNTPSMWYSITVPPSGVLELQLSNENIEYSVEAYLGCSGTNLGCKNTNSGFLSWQLDYQIPGSTIIFQIAAGTLGYTGPFFICYQEIECPNNLNLHGTVLDDTSYSSTKFHNNIDGIIESDQTIKAGAVIDYNAGRTIELKEGFEVEPGAVFHAYIDGCGNFGGLN